MLWAHKDFLQPMQFHKNHTPTHRTGKIYIFFKGINLRFLHQFPVLIIKILVYKFLIKFQNKDKRSSMAYPPKKIVNLASIFQFIHQIWQMLTQNLCLDKLYMLDSPKVQFDVKFTLLQAVRCVCFVCVCVCVFVCVCVYVCVCV